MPQASPCGLVIAYTLTEEYDTVDDEVEDGYSWDKDKSDAVFRERGFDFEVASAIFLDSQYIEHEDVREAMASRASYRLELWRMWESSQLSGRLASVGVISSPHGARAKARRKSTMPITLVSKEQIRRREGRLNLEKFRATTEADIQRQKRDDGMDNAVLGPLRLVAGPDVRSLRKRLGMTQEQFATAFDLSLRTLQGWEQRHWVPDGAGRVLMSLIAYDPEAVKSLILKMREAASRPSSIKVRK